VKPVGEPDTGNRYARFDERDGKWGAGLRPQATAPILDSTRADSEAFKLAYCNVTTLLQLTELRPGLLQPRLAVHRRRGRHVLPRLRTGLAPSEFDPFRSSSTIGKAPDGTQLRGG
jgi:hypothetical protein